MATFTLAEIAALVDGTLVGDESATIGSVANLKSAGGQDLSFLSSKAYVSALKDCGAGCILLESEFSAMTERPHIVVDNPYYAYALVSHWFAPVLRDRSGIAASAVIHPDATVGDNVSVGHHVLIESGVKIGSGTQIDAGVVIEQDTEIGEDCWIKANVTIAHSVTLGNRVIVHPNTTIGTDGFGFANEKGQWKKIAQLGSVRIGDDVDIGASTTIDRGAIDDTIIGNNVIIDNQIQIAHNVDIGEGSALAGSSGVAGSATIGKGCTIGGGACINGHITLGDDVHVTGMAMVTKSLPNPGVYSSGVIIDEQSSWRRNAVRFRQLDKMAQRLSKLEKKVAD